MPQLRRPIFLTGSREMITTFIQGGLRTVNEHAAEKLPEAELADMISKAVTRCYDGSLHVILADPKPAQGI